MDHVDRAILAELQADGRLTVTGLADRVRLTPGPCHRRLRELERSGVITGYRALVDPAAVGMGFEALVQITLERGDAGTIASFEAAVVELPQVRHAERLFGDPDYLLRVVARDLDSFAALRDQRLATLPGVHRLTSTIVMKRIVENRPLPLATEVARNAPPQPHRRLRQAQSALIGRRASRREGGSLDVEMRPIQTPALCTYLCTRHPETRRDS